MVRPTDRPAPARLWQFAPFIGLFAIAFALLAIEHPKRPDLAIAAGLVFVGTIALVFWLTARPQRTPEVVTLIPVVLLCVVVHLLRASSHGGGASGFGNLLFTPVIWQSLRRGRPAVAATVAIVVIANVVAVLTLPSVVSATAMWRSVVLFACVAATAAATINGLVEERKRLIDQVTSLAEHDALTGLANRRQADRLFPLAIADATPARPVAVAVLDLDFFKRYNDAHGHQAGDELLQQTAEAWRTALRPGDVLFRQGGEEFALLLPDTDEAGAASVLARLQAVMPSGQTVSAGYTILRPAGTEDDPTDVSSETLLARADGALYEAKAAGRNRVLLAAG